MTPPLCITVSFSFWFNFNLNANFNENCSSKPFQFQTSREFSIAIYVLWNKGMSNTCLKKIWINNNPVKYNKNINLEGKSLFCHTHYWQSLPKFRDLRVMFYKLHGTAVLKINVFLSWKNIRYSFFVTLKPMPSEQKSPSSAIELADALSTEAPSNLTYRSSVSNSYGNLCSLDIQKKTSLEQRQSSVSLQGNWSNLVHRWGGTQP